MRAKCLQVVVALVLSALFAGEAAAQVGRVSGIVKDDSGNTIKGATVTADNANIGPTTYTASTDDKGRFTIIGLRAGQWRFTAFAPGHAGRSAQPGAPGTAIVTGHRDTHFRFLERVRPGDEVILNPPVNLAEGSKVEAQAEAPPPTS